LSNRRSQNSIIILTTLGVYLGLVLVGATPVLGHAATTRHFEISDEIEIKDDLDRKPDDERDPLDLSIGNYYADLEYFISSLSRLNRIGKFDLAADTFEIAQSTVLPCVHDDKIGSYTAESFIVTNATLRPTLEWAEKQMTDGYGLADCIPSERFSGQDATHSKFVLKLTSNGLSLEVSNIKSSPADARAFLKELDAAWSLFRKSSTGPAQKAISDRTRLSATGCNVLVVTRLPRAALDTLLAKDAK